MIDLTSLNELIVTCLSDVLGLIERAVTDQTMRQHAADLGEKVCSENGVGEAVRIICQDLGV